MAKRETGVVEKIKKYLIGLPKCFFWKEHGGAYGTNGIPDLIICLNGKFVAIEVKTDAGRPTKLQLRIIDEINRCGGYASIAHNVDEVKKFLLTNDLLEEGESK